MTNSTLSFTSAEIVNGYAIMRVVGTVGGFTCYTIGLDGKSFQTLKAARTYARRLPKIEQPSALAELEYIVKQHREIK
jgi:hypothetical protein